MKTLTALIRSQEADEKTFKGLKDSLIYIGSICEGSKPEEACTLIVEEVRRVLGDEDNE